MSADSYFLYLFYMKINRINARMLHAVQARHAWPSTAHECGVHSHFLLEIQYARTRTLVHARFAHRTVDSVRGLCFTTVVRYSLARAGVPKLSALRMARTRRARITCAEAFARQTIGLQKEANRKGMHVIHRFCFSRRAYDIKLHVAVSASSGMILLANSYEHKHDTT